MCDTRLHRGFFASARILSLWVAAVAVPSVQLPELGLQTEQILPAQLPLVSTQALPPCALLSEKSAPLGNVGASAIAPFQHFRALSHRGSSGGVYLPPCAANVVQASSSSSSQATPINKTSCPCGGRAAGEPRSHASQSPSSHPRWSGLGWHKSGAICAGGRSFQLGRRVRALYTRSALRRCIFFEARRHAAGSAGRRGGVSRMQSRAFGLANTSSRTRPPQRARSPAYLEKPPERRRESTCARPHSAQPVCFEGS